MAGWTVYVLLQVKHNLRLKWMWGANVYSILRPEFHYRVRKEQQAKIRIRGYINIQNTHIVFCIAGTINEEY